jgi:hypothetical protein
MFVGNQADRQESDDVGRHQSRTWVRLPSHHGGRRHARPPPGECEKFVVLSYHKETFPAGRLAPSDVSPLLPVGMIGDGGGEGLSGTARHPANRYEANFPCTFVILIDRERLFH